MKFMRRGAQAMSAFIFSCSRRTLSGILIACFHFMVIRGLIDLVYFNLFVPLEEAPSLRHYLNARSSSLAQRNPSFIQLQNRSETVTSTATVQHARTVVEAITTTPSFSLDVPPFTIEAKVVEPVKLTDRSSLRTENLSLGLHNIPIEGKGTMRFVSSNNTNYGFHIPLAETHDFVDIGPNASFCNNDDTFQVGFDFVKGDLKVGTYNLTPGSAYACCRQCETNRLCTHWTWYENYCWLKNGPTAVKAKAGVVAGRVALNEWVTRRIIPNIRRKPYNCSHDVEDRLFFEPWLLEGTNRTAVLADYKGTLPPSVVRYMVINEPRTGSSWLQEVSQMHPGVKVQFELDLEKGDMALDCRQCSRPTVPNSKYANRLPKKLHPPLACGMTLFGANNKYADVSALANRNNATLVILLRVNHVAHAISAYRHFSKPKPALQRALANPAGVDNATLMAVKALGLVVNKAGEILVPWNGQQMRQNVEELRQSYARLIRFPVETGRPAHFIFYEDLKQRPLEVWVRLQKALGLPVVELHNISSLERKSTSQPSLHYLTNLTRIQAELAGSPWRDMIMDPDYDEIVNLGHSFSKICRRFPDANISWRRHQCVHGRLVTWPDEPPDDSDTANTTSPAPPPPVKKHNLWGW